MKKGVAIILVFVLLIGALPQITEAKRSKEFERDLGTYLQEISKKRGFSVTKGDIEYSLGIYEMMLSDFGDIRELKDFMGVVIEKDGGNLQQVYDDHALNADEVKALLQEHGESLDDYIFIYDLYLSVEFYAEEKVVRDPDFDQNLEIWLQEVSRIRGFEVTRKDIESSLALYEEKLDSFKTVERVSDFLGEVIKNDLSNLDWVYEMYDYDEERLMELLQENGFSIQNYVFVDDLMYELDSLISWEEEDFLGEILAQFMSEYGITEDELLRLEEHFISIEEDLMQEEVIEKLFDLSYRLMEFEEFETATEITAEQAMELLSIYKELVTIFQVKIEYTLIQSGEETPLALNDLFAMDELVNANLKISIYNLQGEFLADLIITGEMVDSQTLHDTGNKLTSSLNKVKEDPMNSIEMTNKKTSTVKEDSVDAVGKTVKGARLPDTASDYGIKGIGWLIVSLIGIVLYRGIRRFTSEK